VNQHVRGTHSPQVVHAGSKTYLIPAQTQVWISNARMQWDPRVWGPDAGEFRPSRFHPLGEGDEAAGDKQKRHFLPWSRGARQCPGMRLAQIEFVAMCAVLFPRARVECALRKDETVEMARQRTLNTVRDSQPRISMQINRPKDVVLDWKVRASSMRFKPA
jgi:cytochrome P450